MSPQLYKALSIVALVIGTMIVLIIIFFLAFRVTGQLEASGDTDVRKNLMRSIRGLQLFIGFLLLALVSGLSQMRGKPLLPNLIGITVNLLWQIALFSALRTKKVKLRQLDVKSNSSLIDNNETTYLKVDTQ